MIFRSLQPNPRPLLLPALLALAISLGVSAASIPLRFDSGANQVALNALPQNGTVFILGAPELPGLIDSPAIIFQSNTPLPDGFRVTLPSTGDFVRSGFFRAAFWAGLAPVLVDIPAGTFVMGTPPNEAEISPWNTPQTVVTLTYAFKMGKYEVTQAEYQTLMGTNPSYYSGVTNRPVEQVIWADAIAYCERLTASQRAAGCLPPGWRYRLPTEAEWEYACRAGTTTAFAYGPALRSGMANFSASEEYDEVLGRIFNPAGVTVGRPTTVGSYAPNAWGIYDMHGNLWEWCLDRWSDNLPGGSVTNPQGPEVGSSKVVRGGCYYNAGRICRSAYRGKGNPAYRGNETGFRVVLAPQ